MSFVPAIRNDPLSIGPNFHIRKISLKLAYDAIAARHGPAS
jgi:hypothetical protein